MSLKMYVVKDGMSEYRDVAEVSVFEGRPMCWPRLEEGEVVVLRGNGEVVVAEGGWCDGG